MEATMPLLVSFKPDQNTLPFVLTGSSEVIATSLKSSQDGKAFMLRLFNCSDQANSIALEMNGNNLYESSPLEETGQVLNGKIQLDPWEIYTIKGVAE
jgi:alpha-mannosidase